MYIINCEDEMPALDGRPVRQAHGPRRAQNDPHGPSVRKLSFESQITGRADGNFGQAQGPQVTEGFNPRDTGPELVEGHRQLMDSPSLPLSLTIIRGLTGSIEFSCT